MFLLLRAEAAGSKASPGTQKKKEKKNREEMIQGRQQVTAERERKTLYAEVH